MIKKLLFSSLLMTGLATSAQTGLFAEDFETEAGRNAWINTDRDGDTQKTAQLMRLQDITPHLGLGFLKPSPRIIR